MFALDRLVVPVSDLEAARAFWTALLGHGPTDSGGGAYRCDGLVITLDTSAGRDPGGDLDFRLSHEEPDAVLRRLQALPGAGAAIEAVAGGGRVLTARDPDGNRVTVAWRMPQR